MPFLNPILLFGLAAVSIPIVIHLLNRRKFDRVVWAAMRFLSISVQRNQKRLKIEDMLLLALRCAMLALLVLCLARPAIRSISSGLFGQAKVTAVLVLDNSYSMSQNNGVTSRFDRAKDALNQCISNLPSNSSVAIILASDISNKVIPQPTSDLDLARSTLRDARMCDRSTNLMPAFADAIEILKASSSFRKELYLATDGQLSGFQQLNDICKLLDANKPDIHAHILLTGQPETQNLSVSDLKMGSDIPAVGQVLSFDVEVTNWGTEPASGIHVQLHLDDEAPSAEAAIDKIDAGQSRSVTLTARVRAEGYHTATATIPTDRLPADDRRTIAFQCVSQVNVLLVDGNPGAEARDSEVFFLRNAVVPVPRAMADQYFVKATTVLSSELSAQQLDAYQAVVLADVPDFSDKALQELDRFVRRGGGLVIFPGENTRPAAYNRQLLQQYGLLPASLDATDGDSSRKAKPFRLAGQPLDHPIVSVWGDPESGNLAAVNFYKRYLLTPAPAPAAPQSPDVGAVRVVLRFSDQRPFMLERTLGQGRVILFASTASTRWNDLADHAGIFVPLIYRTLGWTVLEQNRHLNVKVGEKLILHPGMDKLDQEASIIRPASHDTAAGDTATGHDSRRVELDARQIPRLEYEDTDNAGEYDIVFGRDKPIKFAAQADKNESSLQDIGPAQRTQLAASAVALDWKPGLDLKALLQQERVGTELWMPIAVIVLILATAETFLADWFSQPK